MRISILVLILFLISYSFSVIIVNSYDGRDVVVGTYYAAALGEEVFFVPQESSVEMVTSKIGGFDEEVVLIEGKRKVFPGLELSLRNRGYKIKEIINSSDPYTLNFELASRVNPNGFVIASPDFGYNTVAPIPFARKNRYFFIFDIEGKEQEIASIVDSKPVLVYGDVREELLEKLSENPNLIVINNGDKYLDSIELADLLLEGQKNTQVILSDGNFLESTIMNSPYPIVYVSTLTPRVVIDFLYNKTLSNQISTLLVVGEEYTNVAYNIRREINEKIGEDRLSTFVKLGEAIPPLSQPVPSPIFPLPSPFSSIVVEEVVFNNNTNTLTISFRNKGNSIGYFTYSITVYDENNNALFTFSSDEILELKEGDSYVFRKQLDLGNLEGYLEADVRVEYGTSKTLLDNGYVERFVLTFLSLEEKTSLVIEDAKYDKESKTLTLSLRNTGEVDAFYKVFLYYKDKDGKDVEVEEQLSVIEAGRNRIILLRGVDLPYSDILIEVKYGYKENLLVKSAYYTLRIEEEDLLKTIAVIVLIIYVIVLLKKLLMLKTKKVEK